MKKTPLPILFFVCCWLFFPSMAKASGYKTGEPASSYAKAFCMRAAVTDTVPPGKPQTSDATAEKKEELIKEVPKARKQDKPVAVIPVNVKPVLVKPKVIIKPIIKIH